MMDLNAAQVFVQVVKIGSFTGAAKSLGLPISTVSDRVIGLEKQLGATLLTRTTRRLSLTEVGQTYCKKAEEALRLMTAANEEASTSHDNSAGALRITAPAEFAAQQIAEAVLEYQMKFPRVLVEIDCTNRTVDLVAEGYDIAIRGGKLRDSSLRAKRVGVGDQILIASAQYIAKAPKLEHPKDLENHACIDVWRNATDGRTVWQLRTSGGKKARVKPAFKSAATSFAVVIELVKAHAGIALLPQHLVRDVVAAKDAQQVLPDWSTGYMPVHLVYPHQSVASRKVNEMIPILLRHFAEPLF